MRICEMSTGAGGICHQMLTKKKSIRFDCCMETEKHGISTCFLHLRKLPDGEVPEKIKKSRGENLEGSF